MDDFDLVRLGIMGPLMNGPPPRIARDTVNGYIISTVDSYDMGPETAVIDSEHTRILERYTSEIAARHGHKLWVKKALKFKKGYKITAIGYGALVGNKKVLLSSPRKADD